MAGNDQNSAGAATPTWVAGPPAGARPTTLNITAATVIKNAPGYVFTVNVQVAGSGAGSVNDVATNAPDPTNQVAVIPAAVGQVKVEWPCAAGILLVPGTGQTLAISWQ